MQAYTQRNIEAVFRKIGICPFNSRTVLASAISLRRTSGSATGTASVQSYPLDKTPYTKCQLRQQTHRAMTFVKTATEGEICNLLLRFSHAVEYNITSTEIATTEMQRLRQEMKVAKATNLKKDQRVVSRARVCTGSEGLRKIRNVEAGKERAGQSRRRYPAKTSLSTGTHRHSGH